MNKQMLLFKQNMYYQIIIAYYYNKIVKHLKGKRNIKIHIFIHNHKICLNQESSMIILKILIQTHKII